jgi:hypothetical protein
LHIAHDRIHIVFSSNIVLNTARPFHCVPAIANSYQNPASAKQNAPDSDSSRGTHVDQPSPSAAQLAQLED